MLSHFSEVVEVVQKHVELFAAFHNVKLFVCHISLARTVARFSMALRLSFGQINSAVPGFVALLLVAIGASALGRTDSCLIAITSQKSLPPVDLNSFSDFEPSEAMKSPTQ